MLYHLARHIVCVFTAAASRRGQGRSRSGNHTDQHEQSSKQGWSPPPPCLSTRLLSLLHRTLLGFTKMGGHANQFPFVWDKFTVSNEEALAGSSRDLEITFRQRTPARWPTHARPLRVCASSARRFANTRERERVRRSKSRTYQLALCQVTLVALHHQAWFANPIA